MANNELNTEAKIVDAAISIFLLFGYHGTTLQQIADLAGIHKSAIHYYFRSKERLYIKVVSNVLEDILQTENGLISNQKVFEKQRWFLFTELYNNQICFEKTIKELYLNDWDKKLNEIRELVKI